MKRGYFRHLWVIGPMLGIILHAASAAAWTGTQHPCGPGYTRYMWSRTWHAQNSLSMPLDAYFVPRSPGACGTGGYRGQAGTCGMSVSGTSVYGSGARGFEPVHFERLGQVANELDIAAPLGPLPASKLPATGR